MPVIVVFGLPGEIDEETIENVYENLAAVVLQVEELRLQKHQITFFFPPDRMKMDLGKEIVIFVFGLTDKPERTEAVRNQLASNLMNQMKLNFPDAKLVECFVYPFNLAWGFASSKP